MKKLVIMAAMAMAVASASAVEVGIRATGKSGPDNTSFGATVGQKFGKMGVEGGFDRSTLGASSVNRWSVVGSYDVANVGGVTIAPKLGYAIIDPSTGPNGGAFTAGVGASYPLNKKVSLVADYYYQKGMDRVRGFDGNHFAFGAKYSF